MKDFTPELVEERNAQVEGDMQFAQMIQPGAVTQELLEQVKAKFPNALTYFYQNQNGIIHPLRGVLSKDDADNLLNMTMMNAVYILHLLDLANNGAQQQEGGIPDETAKGESKVEGTAAIECVSGFPHHADVFLESDEAHKFVEERIDSGVECQDIYIIPCFVHEPKEG